MNLDLKKILREISPSKDEQKNLEKATKLFLNKIKKDLIKQKATAVLGGSVGKGTWLSGNHDIDIFMQFPDDKEISNKLEKILKKNFKKVERIHGSRDYFRVKFENYSFELIPVLKIKKIEQAKNVTDCSIFHINWVKKHTNPKLYDEIRLAKQFCKSARVYGAETYIKGFSGYVLEILIVYFGSFNNFIKGINNLKENTLIDISAHKKALDRNKLSPIILIDPVQGDRNAAAALSLEKFNKLKETSHHYLKSPSYDFFKIKKQNQDELKKRFDIVLEIKPLEGKDDVIGTKILKAFEYIQEKINKEGFLIKEQGWQFDSPAFAWLSVKNKEIPKEYIHLGPPLAVKEHVEKFKKIYRNSNLIEKNNRITVKLKRKNPNIKDFVKALLKDAYIKERVKEIKIV